MFDIGFWELFLIFILLLFVVGPDKLPVVAEYLGRWFGKIQDIFLSLKTLFKMKLAMLQKI